MREQRIRERISAQLIRFLFGTGGSDCAIDPFLPYRTIPPDPFGSPLPTVDQIQISS